MKHWISVALVALTLCAIPLTQTGCTTTGSGGIGGVITPTRVKAVAYLGTALALQQHPEYRMGFTLAVEQLKVIETQDTIDFATVLAIVHRLPVKQLEGQNAVLYITAATLLLDDLGGSLDLSKVEKIRPYVTGLREGIELGLGPTVPPSASLRPSVEQRLSALEDATKLKWAPTDTGWFHYKPWQPTDPMVLLPYADTLEAKPWQSHLLHITTNTLEWKGDPRFVFTP